MSTKTRAAYHPHPPCSNVTTNPNYVRITFQPQKIHPFQGHKTPGERQRKPQVRGLASPLRRTAKPERAAPSAGPSGRQTSHGLEQGWTATTVPSARRPDPAPGAAGPRASGQPVRVPASDPLPLLPTSSLPGPQHSHQGQVPGSPGALTLEGGPLMGVPVPAPLHEAQEGPAGPRPGSAHGRQLRAVALHHFHHDVQNVLLVCKGEAGKSGQLRGRGPWASPSGGGTCVTHTIRRPHDGTRKPLHFLCKARRARDPSHPSACLRSPFQALEIPYDVPDGTRARITGNICLGNQLKGKRGSKKKTI